MAIVYFSIYRRRVTQKVETMCNLTDLTEESIGTRGVKRKSMVCDFDEIFIPPKRVSPFLNTPKEKKDLKKRILKISIQKLKQTENAELFLRRSVLINNTMKRLQNELRKEKKRHNILSCYNNDKDWNRTEPGTLNNNCLLDSILQDDPFLSGVHEQITDDMTDTLVVNLENKLGIRITSLSTAIEERKCSVDMTKYLPTSKADFAEKTATEFGSCVNNGVPSNCFCTECERNSIRSGLDSSNNVSESFHVCVSVNLNTKSRQQINVETPSLYKIQQCFMENNLLT